MGVFKGFTFDGISSLDYGIYTTGTSVYNAPERDVEMIEIAGKNGALAIDNGRWQNIEVTYTCSTFAQDSEEFAEKLRAFINEICSRVSYVRLEDDYNPDEYRLALYRAGVDVEAAARNKAGEFDLIFDCKPQRFLTSGEDTITVGDWGDVTEYSGDIVTFEADEMTAIKSLSVDLSPVQNLNGYDHPWVGGAGKNKLKTTATTATTAGVTFTVANDGTITANGTATSNIYLLVGQIDLTGGTAYTMTGCPSGISGENVILYVSGAPSTFGSWTDYGTGATKTPDQDYSGIKVYIRILSGYTVSNLKFYPMIRLASVTDATWEPYSNICPITGWDGVSVYRTGRNLLNPSGFRSRANVSINGEIITATADDTRSFAPLLQAFFNGTYIRNLTSGTISSPVLFTKDKTYNCLVFGHNGQAKDIKVTMDVGNLPDGTYLFSWRMLSSVTPLSWDNMMIRLTSDTDNTYEPYQGTTYTQEFEDSQGNTLTVYGGEDEIVGGVLTVTHNLVDMGDLTFSKNTMLSGFDRFAVTLSDMKPTANATAMLSAISSAYEGKNITEANNTPRAGLMAGLSTVVYFYEIANAFTVEEFKTARSGQTLCYELATPITYTLTPQQVETLIGTNKIWSDAGEVTVEVADDPNKIINPTLYNAKPLIKVNGYGTVTIGSVTITIEGSASDVTYIDCDSMECYRYNGQAIVSANSAVSFSSYDFPVLTADAITGISYSTNISQVQIVPRWWRL